MFRKTCFGILALLLTLTSPAQSFDVAEKTPVIENGFEYGYLIKNEQIKKAGDEEYSRYEITFYITNKSNCNKIYRDRPAGYSYEGANLLATFNCRNANGKRLTSKTGQVKARDFYLSVKKKEGGKEITESVKAGYIFRNSETLRNNVIVLVPKGELPDIQFTINMLDELY